MDKVSCSRKQHLQLVGIEPGTSRSRVRRFTTAPQRSTKIETSLYSKPTDKHLYLHIKSEHPTSVKKVIPYGLGIRLKRISSRDEDYQREKKEACQLAQKERVSKQANKGTATES